MTVVLAVLTYFLAALIALVLVAVIRTLCRKPPQKIPQPPVPAEKEKLDAYGEGLASLVRIPTISKNAGEDLSAFHLLHAQLETLFPLVHRTLERIEIDGTLLYHWKSGHEERKPVLFMGHQDVVPAPSEGWTLPPFAGEIRDGALYGRGTLDSKCNPFMQLSAVEELLQEGFTPSRDVYIEAAINEETSGDSAPSAVRYLQSKGVELDMVLDEGGTVIDQAMKGMDRPYAVVGVTEKGYMDVRITARGDGGHSSTPPRNTPIARLAAFIREVETKRPFQKKLLPEVAEMFASMAPSFGFGMRLLLGNLWLFKPLLIAIMPRVSPFGEALLSTTCTFTMMKGSDAANVIPSEAYVVANLRTSFQQGCAASLGVLKSIGKKYDLDFEVLQQREASPMVSTKTSQYAYLQKCIAHQFPDCGIAPYMIMGGTDCRHFHAVCDNCFRFSPVRMTTQQLESCHGVDENITVSAIAEGIGFYQYFLKNDG